MIAYALAGDRRPARLESAATNSFPGAFASFAARASSTSASFAQAIGELERSLEVAGDEPDVERFDALRGCVVDSDGLRISAAITRFRNGSLT